MAKIDKEKEEIGLLKFWIGVSVASIMGLISWFVNNFEKSDEIILIFNIVSIVIVAILIVFLNKTVLDKIKKLKDIK
ncbi:MAG: hypothetical protein DRG11_00485 [Epsilonproteobacteria bacterium]|nr:MAG: hypothetical protein DRG11_00485 [Campylobacterota bacterium]